MLALGPSLGCPTPEFGCLCRLVNFGYGIRDCANAACGPEVGAQVIAYGVAACAAAGVGVAATEVTGAFPSMYQSPDL